MNSKTSTWVCNQNQRKGGQFLSKILLEPKTRSKGRLLWINPAAVGEYFYMNSQMQILLEMRKEGYSSDLLAVRSKTSSIGDSQVHLVPIKYVPVISPIIFAIALLLFLPIYTLRLNPDYVIMTPDISVISSFFSSLLCRLNKTRFILDVRTTPVEITGFRGFLQKFWFSASILVSRKFFDGMTVITPLMKKEICDTYDVDPKRVGVWTSGVSTELFDPESFLSQRQNLKEKFGLVEKFVVFYHGIFTPNRALPETIEAIKSLSHTCPPVVLFLLGSGPSSSTLAALVQEEKLENNILIHEPVAYDKVPEFISISDVCIVPLPDHPYWRFQCPLKLLEYLAMEKVTIVTDIPAHRAIVGNNNCGIYISSTEPKEIGRALIYAFHHRQKLEEWGKSGRLIVQKKYTWKKVAKDLDGYLSSVKSRVFHYD
jgi:glycosyltransferase involved in cell wall biosynthesis